MPPSEICTPANPMRLAIASASTRPVCLRFQSVTPNLRECDLANAAVAVSARSSRRVSCIPADCNSPHSRLNPLVPAHRSQELRIGPRTAQLVEQQLHALDRRQRRQHLAQYPDPVEL